MRGREAKRGARGLALAALAVGCAPSPTPDQQDSHFYIKDDSDRCQTLKPGCPGLEDDGCPEPMIDLAQGCASERTQAKLRELSNQLKAEARFTRVVVKGDPYLAECVASALHAAGFEASRVQAQNDKTPYVSFEVVAWDGADCR